MKKFIITVVLAGFTCIALSLYIYLQFFFVKGDVNLELAMQLAEKKYPFVIKKIRIGDSVGRQFHDTGTEPDSGIVNLTTNGAASLLGNYLLLKKLTTLNKDNLSDSLEVEGYFRPSSITYNLDEETTTNYVIKNFYSDKWFFDTTLLDAPAAAYIDSAFLNVYPKRKIIRKLEDVKLLKAIIKIPIVLNPGMPVKPNTNSLANTLTPKMEQFFPRYKTIYCPVSQSKSLPEIKQEGLIGPFWKAKQPLRILPDSLFLSDNLHLKHKV